MEAITMNALTIFQIALEFWGIVLCCFSCTALLLSHMQSRTSQKLKLVMQISCILLLINDIIAYIFRGTPGLAAFYLVRISNFFVFSINFIYMALFTRFLWRSLAIPANRVPKRMYLVYGLSIIGILLLILSQFTGILYYIDAQNLYHRGPFYIISQLLAILGIILNFTLLMQYRRQLDRPLFYAMLSYFILPSFATVALIFIYGIALQNIALVVSTQIMFSVDFIDMSLRLQRTQDAFLQAHFKAEHDPLTGLFNKAAGLQKMKTYIESMQSDHTASLLFVDIDDFKKINDSLGHSAGDYWIMEIANLLYALCTSDDIVCRFGGDEYTVLLTNVTDRKTLETKIQTFMQCLQEKAHAKSQEVHCSIGICSIYGSGHSLETCVELADAALYDAKRKGKNGFCLRSLQSNS
ncbi:MAG TPA: GGDEF domain-containing protein [Lachnospiraceae bacterium]|nr:GGDEF domain-containing protein [Lachnospiraceae bacterium]